MTLQIDDDQMTSPDTVHRAVRISKTAWLVTWLRRDHRLTRNQAITAMTIAETVTATITAASGPLDKKDPVWPFLVSWAGELGLGAADAIRMTTNPPLWEV